MPEYIFLESEEGGEWEKIKRRKIKEELQKYLRTGQQIGKIGEHLVRIPIVDVDIPTFRHDPNEMTGVGHGDGEIGDPIGSGDPQKGEGGAGNMPGEHILEVDVPLELLIEVLREELELPPMSPKKKAILTEKKEKYSSISLVGPEGLRHFKRTYKEALKRQIISGKYNFRNPTIIPIQKDKRYKFYRIVLIESVAGIFIFLLDISGSMWDEQKEMARTLVFWIQTWAVSEYPLMEMMYIVHDTQAHQVDEETFFHIRESGGTVISSAYKEVKALIDPKQGSVRGTQRIFRSTDEYNVYLFHISDGDNWSQDDTNNCIDILEKDLLPYINLFGYFQTKSEYGTGQFKTDLDNHFKKYQQWAHKVKTTEMMGREEVLDGLKDVLGKSKGGAS